MSNTNIGKAKDVKEKAATYSYQMQRYKLATEQGFYFEAIVIAYAMIEDRLLAFLHFAGVIDRRTDNNQAKQKIHISEQAQNQINTLLSNDDNHLIDLTKIQNKIKIINKLMKLPEENNDQYLNLVHKQINKTINKDELNALFKNLNTWLKLRNQIIHALMCKRTPEVLNYQADIAKEGYTIGRALDGFVSKLKAGNKDGIRIS